MKKQIVAMGLALLFFVYSGFSFSMKQVELKKMVKNDYDDEKIQNILKYDVVVPDALKVPYKNAKPGYFEKGMVTGFGSAATFKGFSKEGEIMLYALTDRGPNADGPDYKNGDEIKPSKIFPVPCFTPSIGTIVLKEKGEAQVLEAITIKNEAGKNISGLPLTPGIVGATGEVPLNEELQVEGFDKDGLDPEGIAIDQSGHIWICDEYGPFLIQLDNKGKLLKKYAPGKGLPEALSARIPNRGAEGLSITPNGKLVMAMQSVLDVDGKTTKTATFTRIVVLDPKTDKVVQYAYPVDLSQYKKAKDCKIGDIYAINETQFLVIEQGKNKEGKLKNHIYLADIGKASDITHVLYEGKAPEYAKTEADLKGVKYVQKIWLTELTANGWTAEKAEGIFMVPGDDKSLILINDNDFGISTKFDVSDDITDYIYNGQTKKYEMKEMPQNTIKENREPAQVWKITFKKPIISYMK